MRDDDPKEVGATPPFKPQQQQPPGHTRAMDPPPDHGEKSYRGSGKLEGRAYCLIDVDPHLVATIWRPWRPFQGWRYLTPADAPPDAPSGISADAAAGALPERMIAELRALGLW